MKYYYLLFGIQAAYCFNAYYSQDHVDESGNIKNEEDGLITEDFGRNVKKNVSYDLSTEEGRYLLHCIVKCSKEAIDFDVVCATDFHVYASISQVKCARICGLDIRVMNFDDCPKDEKNNTTTLTAEQTKYCISNCQRDDQYSPVCGTDNVTYDNRDQLSCAYLCGVDVDVLKPEACSEISYAALFI